LGYLVPAFAPSARIERTDRKAAETRSVSVLRWKGEETYTWLRPGESDRD